MRLPYFGDEAMAGMDAPTTFTDGVFGRSWPVKLNIVVLLTADKDTQEAAKVVIIEDFIDISEGLHSKSIPASYLLHIFCPSSTLALTDRLPGGR